MITTLNRLSLLEIANTIAAYVLPVFSYTYGLYCVVIGIRNDNFARVIFGTIAIFAGLIVGALEVRLANGISYNGQGGVWEKMLFLSALGIIFVLFAIFCFDPQKQITNTNSVSGTRIFRIMLLILGLVLISLSVFLFYFRGVM